MKWLQWAEDTKLQIGAAIVALGGLGLKYRQARTSELLKLVHELQEELTGVRTEVKELNSLVRRFGNSNNYQRLEIFLHNRSRNDVTELLTIALDRTHAGKDVTPFLEQAIAKLGEDIVVPEGHASDLPGTLAINC